MLNNINTWLIRLFCVFWALFLFIDYANNSGYLTMAYTYFEYTGLIITAILIAFGITFVFAKRKNNSLTLVITNYRNIYNYLFLLLFMGLIMVFYLNKTEITSMKGSGTIMFLIKTIGFHFSLIPILAAAFGSGKFVVSRTGIVLTDIAGFFVSLAVGFVFIAGGLFLLGTIGLLNQIAVSILIVLLIIPGWKQIAAFIQNHLLKKNAPFEIHAVAVLPFGLIIFLVALNLCYTTRPFPIGFDDLNQYMNIPKLIAGYGALTQGGDAYNWSLMMSMGFIIYKSATIAILISVLPGMLSLFVLYIISRRMSVSREWSLFACLLFYTFPTVIWQSRNDAKVDFALLFITLCSVLLLMEYYFNRKTQEPVKTDKLNFISAESVVWVLSGLLVGFAFGIKYTSLLSIFAFLTYLFYVKSGAWAAAGMFFLNFTIIFALKLTRFAAFETSSLMLPLISLGVALPFFIIALKKNTKTLLHSIGTACIFCLVIGVTFIPWAIKNISENKTVSFSALLTGKSPLPQLYSDPKDDSGTNRSKRDRSDLFPGQQESLELMVTSPTSSMLAGFNPFQLWQKQAALFANASKKDSKPLRNTAEKRDESYTDKYEEIRRYLGYEKGIIRFISLPYDLAMKANVKLWSADTGILLLIILPVFMLIFNARHLALNLFKMMLMVLLLIACMLSVSMNVGPFELDKALELMRTSAFSDSESFKQLLMPIYVLLKKIMFVSGNFLFPLYELLTVQTIAVCFLTLMFGSPFIYLLYRGTTSPLDKKSKSLIAFVYCTLIFWLILSSGIVWYGIVGFALLMVVVAIFVNHQAKSSHTNHKFAGVFVTICTTLWILLILPFQFMPVKFTLVKDMNQVDFKGFIDRPFGKYAIGENSEKEVFRQFFQPAEQSILQILNNDKNAGILNVSTFLTYHIVNNDKRVYADNQLGIFDKIYKNANSNPQETLNEFKKKGIKYIVISLYTPTLDVTPEKSLSKKYSNLMTLLVNNPGSKLHFTNRVVERPDGNMNYNSEGKQYRAMYHLAGMRMLSFGSVALFEIL